MKIVLAAAAFDSLMASPVLARSPGNEGPASRRSLRVTEKMNPNLKAHT
jgi:hypothetical protein